MCVQPYARCRNSNCLGKAQILPLRPCGSRPNCHITEHAEPRQSTGEQHCPDCRIAGDEKERKKKRKQETDRAWHAKNRERRKAAAGRGLAVQAGGGESRVGGGGDEFGAVVGLGPGAYVPTQAAEDESLPQFPAPGPRLPIPTPTPTPTPAPAPAPVPTLTPAAPAVPIDPALQHVDAIMANGGSIEEAQEYLGARGLWPESKKGGE